MLTAVMAVVGVIYTLIAAALTARFIARRSHAAVSFPAVSIIKPLHGAPDGLARALERFCDQDYPGPIQIVFGVHDAGDPAVQVVERLRAERPGIDIALVIDPQLHGANRKASNLANIAARASHEVLVLSDADILVEPDYLRRVTAALHGPGVGAVSCLYVGLSSRNLWSRLSAMGIDYQFLPSVVLGKSIGMAQPCFGSTIAMTRAVLAEIGGFEAVAHHLADDYEIGRAVRARGYSIAIPAMTVAHHCTETDRSSLIDHELRWARTVRQIDPAGYAGSIITYPVPLALVAAALSGFAPWSAALIVATWLARLSLKVCVDSVSGARAGPWWLVPARDCLSFGVFLASFAVNTVGWQGRRFRVGPGGLILQS
ncbi:MAG TPA: bacteriohopanetetrol glucosamine biosynthesis glycosyltransferase HpnI [Caulobacteraceae bacterium]|nr:bacteriohopanetetrol glucosamine biosynthesis glycosyltransferase HpnI [Caulobacteraceae bacterium]